jgi:hypothetical protein
MHTVTLILLRWLLCWAMLLDALFGIVTLGFVTPHISMVVATRIKAWNRTQSPG